MVFHVAPRHNIVGFIASARVLDPIFNASNQSGIKGVSISHASPFATSDGGLLTDFAWFDAPGPACQTTYELAISRACLIEAETLLIWQPWREGCAARVAIQLAMAVQARGTSSACTAKTCRKHFSEETSESPIALCP
jgi:hypothetical protein